MKQEAQCKTRERTLDGKPEELFAQCVACYARSMVRLAEARLASAEASVAFLNSVRVMLQPSPLKLGLLDTPEKICRELASVPPRTIDAYRYVSHLAHLVYATTLFDTFLQDVVEFCLFMYPGAIGDSTLTFDSVIKASGWADIVNQATKKKVRDIGYLSFVDRINWLKKTFGLSFRVPDKVLKRLTHFSDVRNTVVHDQGFFDFERTDTRSLVLTQKTCPLHPTPVSFDDVGKSMDAQAAVVASIARAVYEQLLKKPMPEELNLMVNSRAGKMTGRATGESSERERKRRK